MRSLLSNSKRRSPLRRVTRRNTKKGYAASAGRWRGLRLESEIRSWELVEHLFDASVSPERLDELISVWDTQISRAEAEGSLRLADFAGSVFAQQVSDVLRILEPLRAAELRHANDLLSSLLELLHRPLARPVGLVEPLRDDAVEPFPAEPAAGDSLLLGGFAQAQSRRGPYVINERQRASVVVPPVAV